MKRVDAKKKQNWIYVVCDMLFVGVLLIITWQFERIQWDTSDDVVMSARLAGWSTGIPNEETVYEGALWGKFVKSLYTLFGNVPWYSFLYIFFIWVSLSVCFWSFRTKYTESLKDFVIRLLWFMPVYIGVFLWPATQMQFTTTTALIGSSILCLIIKSESNTDGLMDWKIYLIIIGLLSLFMFELRLEVCYIWLGVIIYTYAVSLIFSKKELSRIVVEFGLIALIFVFVVLSNLLHDKLSGEWEYKHIYDSERRQYTDYDELPYDDYRELYGDIGWSKELIPLTRDFFLMDRNINAEAFSRINETRRGLENGNILGKLKDGIRRVYAYPYYNNLCMAGIIACGCLGIVFLRLKNKKIRVTIFSACSYLVMFGLGAVMIAGNGRFENRVFWMLMITLIPPMVLQISNVNRELSNDNTLATKKNIRILAMASGILVLACLVVGGFGQMKNRIDKTEAERIYKLIAEYCNDNADNVYIRDGSIEDIVNPLDVIEKGAFSNLFSWGGWEMNSAVYYDQLRINGLDELYSEDFFNDRVFMISRSDNYIKMMNDYMVAKYPDSTLEIVDKNADFTVYRFNHH